MMRVFVSSVQNELEDERLIVQNLINTDPFLSAHCEPVLYEFEPASGARADEECIEALGTCQVEIVIIWREYGRLVDGLSMTHREYKSARERGLARMIYLRGGREVKREPETEAFIKEIETDGLKYKRFGNVIELQKEVRAALAKLLKERFGTEPSSDENLIARQNIEATSEFESRPLTCLRWEDLDHQLYRKLVASAEKRPQETAQDAELLKSAYMRGLIWRDAPMGAYYATAAGVLLLAPDPSAVFPQCRILADAYRGTEPDGEPHDHEDIRAPLPLAVDRALAFIDRNTRHPMRVIGLNRLRLDEYPQEALREALVNAAAHRRYEDSGRKIILEVFRDRVVVSSPGLPPAPLTLAMLRSGRYRPCSRNPVIAQCLSFFHRIEERGSGFRRMMTAMERHGLDRARLETDTGYFQIIFPGPGEDMNRIRVAAGDILVPPDMESRLSDRQKRIVRHLLKTSEATAAILQREIKVSRPVITSDLGELIKLQIIEKTGAGPSTRYRLLGLNHKAKGR